MITIKEVKSSFTNNLSTMLVLGIVWWNLNAKINDLLINKSVSEIKVFKLEDDVKDIKKRISNMETKITAHLGEAYIKEDDYKIEEEYE